jgi:hypothetical protein
LLVHLGRLDESIRVREHFLDSVRTARDHNLSPVARRTAKDQRREGVRGTSGRRTGAQSVQHFLHTTWLHLLHHSERASVRNLQLAIFEASEKRVAENASQHARQEHQYEHNNRNQCVK